MAPYDAIIVGGGPAGATAALLLARAGWRIVVIEKAAFPRRKVCGEFISGATWRLLRQLGIAAPLLEIAGPVVGRVGVYAGAAMVTAELANCDGVADAGRALGREHLDTLLLQSAAAAGVEVRQPGTLAGYATHADGHACTVIDRGTRMVDELHARLVIAAHGSWESGPLPTQAWSEVQRGSDLFGFKAHFRDTALAANLMPLIAFPGGYGGMVHTDGGRLSLSCCIRRDELERCRARQPGVKAGAAVLAHIRATCKGVDLALSGATLDDGWLAAGPLRTGIRTFGAGGLFAIGNAAAEAHPIVAEGISMAIQSAALLCDRLIAHVGPRSHSTHPAPALDAIRADYARAWRANFSPRLHLAAGYAHMFMRPMAARAAAAVLLRVPRLLTQGARWSGKSEPLRGVRGLSGAGAIRG